MKMTAFERKQNPDGYDLTRIQLRVPVFGNLQQGIIDMIKNMHDNIFCRHDDTLLRLQHLKYARFS